MRRGSRDVHLRPTEFRLPECLLERPGYVFSRQNLLEPVWGPSVDVNDRAVDVYIGRLRKALSTGRERDPIVTSREAGYSFDETFGTPLHYQVHGSPDINWTSSIEKLLRFAWDDDSMTSLP